MKTTEDGKDPVSDYALADDPRIHLKGTGGSSERAVGEVV